MPTPPYSVGLRFAILVLLLLCVSMSLLTAQTVSPETEFRASTVGGVALEANAAFDTEGTYIAWRDTRAEGSDGGDIYVQKLDVDGRPLWSANGVALCVATNTQSLPAITPDDQGGAVVTWLDARSQRAAIFAQRISPTGEPIWTANGVFVGNVYAEQPFSFVHRSDNGSFVVTWWDSAPFVNADLYPVLAQKLTGQGERVWDPGDPTKEDFWGSGIQTINGITRGRSAPDGVGGFLALGKIRDGKGFRCQRVGTDGLPVWPTPVDFTASLPDTVSFNFAPDGAGGVIVAFLDNRDVRVFRMAGDGTLPWGTTGITLAAGNVLTDQIPCVSPNGAGGAFIAWVSSTPHDIRVQQIAADGTLLWGESGATVPDGSTSEREPAMVTDGAGGIFLSFTTATSLRGQKLDRNGTAQWKLNGSNGVGLGSGDLSIIGSGRTVPTVVYKRGSGLAARSIAVAAPTMLTKINVTPNGPVNVTLSGGTPGRTYDLLRGSHVEAASNSAWQKIGTLRPGETFVDTTAPSPGAFYIARDPSR